jgi:hypothetical protein
MDDRRLKGSGIRRAASNVRADLDNLVDRGDYDDHGGGIGERTLDTC